MQRHTEENPYRYVVCGSVFSLSFSLKSHEYTGLIKHFLSCIKVKIFKELPFKNTYVTKNGRETIFL